METDVCVTDSLNRGVVSTALQPFSGKVRGLKKPTLLEPELQEFIDVCLVPILVRDALKEIKAAELRGDVESTPSLHVRCANGDLR